MKKFEEPMIETLEISVEDVITTSEATEPTEVIPAVIFPCV